MYDKYTSESLHTRVERRSTTIRHTELGSKKLDGHTHIQTDRQTVKRGCYHKDKVIAHCRRGNLLDGRRDMPLQSGRANVDN